MSAAASGFVDAGQITQGLSRANSDPKVADKVISTFRPEKGSHMYFMASLFYPPVFPLLPVWGSQIRCHTLCQGREGGSKHKAVARVQQMACDIKNGIFKFEIPSYAKRSQN